jgi:hypothetical protein
MQKTDPFFAVRVNQALINFAAAAAAAAHRDHRNLKTGSLKAKTNGEKVPKVCAPHFISLKYFFRFKISMAQYSIYVLFRGTPPMGTLFPHFLLFMV